MWSRRQSTNYKLIKLACRFKSLLKFEITIKLQESLAVTLQVSSSVSVKGNDMWSFCLC